MSDKPWNQMDGWEKTWEITKVVGGLALLALSAWAAISGGGSSRPISRGRGSTSVWTVGHGGKKGYGSWSSFRHG